MLEQKCSYRQDIGTRKRVKKHRKNRTKIYNLTETSKS